MFASALLGCVLFVSGAAPRAQVNEPSTVRLLDGFEDLARWRVSTSDDVKARLLIAPGRSAKALCVDFDFGTVSGYVTLSRELALDYPDNYEFSFWLRGDAPANALQFKLVDGSGENVWWVNRPDYVFAHEWKHVRFKKRQVSFAWGPAKDHALSHSARLEFVIARGRGGGTGTVCFDELALRTLPDAHAAAPAATASATSMLAPTQPIHAFDGNSSTAWRSDPAMGKQQTLTLDFQQPREFGGIVLHWMSGEHASRYNIDLSDDGNHWRTVRRVVDGNGGNDPHFLPESEARYVRLQFEDGPHQAYALEDIDLKDPPYGDSQNAFIQSIAKEAGPGEYPRGFTGQQSYWTIVGIDGGAAQGLVSEDGALEIAPGTGSIEPFLIEENNLVSWANVRVQQTLRDSYLPIPTVTWLHDGLTLRTTVFANGSRDRSQLLAQYTVANTSDRPRTVTLALAIRPFQVNPPTQFLNVPGGVSAIRALAWDGHALSINGQRTVWPLETPDRFIAADFDAGTIAQIVAEHATNPVNAVKDETGLASGVLLYRLQLAPGANHRVGLVAPLTGAPVLPASDPIGWLEKQHEHAAAYWSNKLNLLSLKLPEQGQPIADTLRTALAHLLINRAGPALQPGSRSYARSWIRDGSMMGDALLRLGHPQVVREFAQWFASHQFSNGKVPCCVDTRGADPVAENDSQGELIHVIAQQYRYTHDKAWLHEMWPHIASAVSYMNLLRGTQRTEQNLTPARRAFYGLMPASISHEGYSDRPAYSFWDDFWSLAGYADARDMAQTLGREDTSELGAQLEQFRSDVHASLRASIEQHGIDYLPASADRGDFDPTATTIALSVAGAQAQLPQPQLQRTFERYWQEFVQRRDGGAQWTEYTPYELRQIGAFVRLGWRERATQLLDFFLADRRPAGWNQWAEVVGRDPRQPRFLGDMPHAWIASDFIQSALDMFAYERAQDHALVLAAGVPADWLAGTGIGINGLRTPYGNLSYALRRDGQRLLLSIAGTLHPPPGGLVYQWPYATAPGRAVSNGQIMEWDRNDGLRIRALPADIVIELSGDARQ